MKKIPFVLFLLFTCNGFAQSWSFDLGAGLTATNKKEFYIIPTEASMPAGANRPYSKYEYGFSDWSLFIYPKNEFMKLPVLTGHSLSFGFPTTGSVNYSSSDVVNFAGSTVEFGGFVGHVSTGICFDINGGMLNTIGKSKLDNIGYYFGMGLGFSAGTRSFDGGNGFGSSTVTPSNNSTIYEYDNDKGVDYDEYVKMSSFGPIFHVGFMFKPPGFFRYVGFGDNSLLGLRLGGQAGLGKKALNYNTVAITWRRDN